MQRSLPEELLKGTVALFYDLGMRAHLIGFVASLAASSLACGGQSPPPSTADQAARPDEPSPATGPEEGAASQGASGLATGQTFAEAMEAICAISSGESPARDELPPNLDDLSPEQRVAYATAHFNRVVMNLQAREIHWALGPASSDPEGRSIREPAARAGVCDCPVGAHLSADSSTTDRSTSLCGEIPNHPFDRDPAAEVTSFEEAVRAFCDTSAQLDVGAGFGSDLERVRHAAFVDARVNNDAFREILLARRTPSGGGPEGASDAYDDYLRRLADAIERAGLSECPFAARDLSAAEADASE